MTDKKTRRTVWGIIVLFLVLVLTALGTVIYGVKDYTDRVPDIRPYTGLTFSQHCDLLPDDLAEITCEDPDAPITKRIADAFWADDTRESVSIEQNGRCVSVGSRTGLLFVTVYAVGAESREETIPVRITEQ